MNAHAGISNIKGVFLLLAFGEPVLPLCQTFANSATRRF